MKAGAQGELSGHRSVPACDAQLSFFLGTTPPLQVDEVGHFQAPVSLGDWEHLKFIPLPRDLPDLPRMSSEHRLTLETPKSFTDPLKGPHMHSSVCIFNALEISHVGNQSECINNQLRVSINVQCHFEYTPLMNILFGVIWQRVSPIQFSNLFSLPVFCLSCLSVLWIWIWACCLVSLSSRLCLYLCVFPFVLNSTESITWGKKRDTSQKSLTKFNKGWSHWLQLTPDPGKKQINIIKQYPNIAFHNYGGYSFYKIVFNLYLLFLANDYHNTHISI